MDKLAFVIEQLAHYAGAKKSLGSSTFIACPSHAEVTPSFRVFHSPTTRSPGYGKCYGCGFHGAWDQWAAQAGLKPLGDSKPSERFSHQFIAELSDEAPDSLVFSDLPENKRWRTIPTNLLIALGARMVTVYSTKYVYLPVNVLGEERGYIKARLRKEEDKPSYVNSKGRWGRDYGLFPFDYVMGRSPVVIVLVEGQRDALRLIAHGIPAMSILGTQSWSAKKAALLDIAGVEHAILAFDGDDAGKGAVEVVTPELSKLMDVTRFDLCGKDSPYWKFRKEEFPSKAAKAAGVTLWDPGNMPVSKINELKTVWQTKSRQVRRATATL
jgi:hypothetical protein